MRLSMKNCPVASRQINQSGLDLGRRQRGFGSIIELMVILIIISILTAIAIPAYGDYIKKARLGEPQVLFSGIKTALETFYQEEDRFPEQWEYDEFELVTTGNDVKETRYFSEPQSLRIEMVVAGFPEPENVIAWQWIAAEHRWTCKPNENNWLTTIRFKYLPKVCRG